MPNKYKEKYIGLKEILEYDTELHNFQFKLYYFSPELNKNR